MSTGKWTFITAKDVWGDLSLSTPAKVIWHQLSGFRNHETGEAYPTMGTLQRLSGYGRHKVERAMAELVKAGAITKKVIRHRGPTGMAGSKCIYTVSQLADWKPRQPYSQNVSIRNLGAPAAGGTTDGPVTITQSKTITHNQTINHTQRLAPLEPFKLTLSETEAVLADRGLDRGEAEHVFARLEDMNWRDPQGRPFTNRLNLEGFVAGLGEKMVAGVVGW